VNTHIVCVLSVHH